MCCCALTCILKCVMSIVNTLLLIMGIVLTVLGALLLWGFSYFLKGVYPIDTYITNMLAKFGVVGNSQGVINLMATNAYAIGAIAFAVGIVLIVFAILGIIFVACCDLKNLLIIIIVIVMIFALGLIILIGIFGVNKTSMIYNPLLGYMQASIINKYQGINSTGPESIFANVLQISVKCCGLYNYTDYNSATNFNRAATNAKGQSVTLPFPISCCDYNSDFTITSDNLDNCITNGTSAAANIGCWTKVQPYLDQYIGYCFLTIGITIAVLVAIMIAGIIAIQCIKKIP